MKCDPAGVEIYASGRFLTVTGHHIEGTPDEIREAPETLKRLLKRVKQFQPPGSASRGPSCSGALGGSDFFRAVNSDALDNLSSWVPVLYGSDAKPQSGSGGYRISSRALGRQLEEDLSITPIGIVDFGVHDMGHARQGKRTPIDLAIGHGGAADAIAAARWLCDQMGIAPERLGWKPKVNGAHYDPWHERPAGTGAQTVSEEQPAIAVAFRTSICSGRYAVSPTPARLAFAQGRRTGPALSQKSGRDASPRA